MTRIHSRRPTLSVLAVVMASLSSGGCADMGLEMPEIPGLGSSGSHSGVYHRPTARHPAPPPASEAPPASEPTPSAGDPLAGAATGRRSTGWTDANDPEPPIFASTPDAPYAPYAPPPPPPTPYGAPGLPPPSSNRLAAPPLPPRISSPDQLAPAAGSSPDDPYYFSFVGKIAPDFVGEGTWITPAPQRTLSALRGQVVFFVFSFQGCEGCKMFMPTLEQWAQQYQPRGMTVIYVDNGVIDPLDYARTAVREQRVSYAYFHDAKAETTKAYGVRSFPTAYLVGKDGVVIWEGAPTAQESVLVPLIEAALAR